MASNEAALLFWLGAWIVVGGMVGFLIGSGKGRGSEGLVLGAVLGVIGWVIVAVQQPTAEVAAQQHTQQAMIMHSALGGGPMPSRFCPWCAEPIQAAAVVCRHCQRDVPPLGPRDPQWAPDPTGRYQHRYWDGRAWTAQVANAGRALDDPAGAV